MRRWGHCSSLPCHSSLHSFILQGTIAPEVVALPVVSIHWTDTSQLQSSDVSTMVSSQRKTLSRERGGTQIETLPPSQTSKWRNRTA